MKFDAKELKEEKKLVERAKYDSEAFGRLYEQNYDSILKYTMHRTGNAQIAQDITAETFLKAFKNIDRFKWQNIPFSAWLYRIANNEVAGWFRKGNYRPVSLDELRLKGFEPLADDDVEQEMLVAQQEIQRHQEYLAVHEKIKLLSPKYQEVIALRFFDGKQLTEIGQILGKPEGTIKSLLHRGLKKLKKEMSMRQESATLKLKQPL